MGGGWKCKMQCSLVIIIFFGKYLNFAHEIYSYFLFVSKMYINKLVIIVRLVRKWLTPLKNS